jgi:hypothetical protein
MPEKQTLVYPLLILIRDLAASRDDRLSIGLKAFAVEP